MIVCNGLVGLCLVVGGMRHHEQEFEVKGASAFLAVLAVLSVLTLVLPNYSTTAPEPASGSCSLLRRRYRDTLLYGVFLYIQTVRHKEFFGASRARRREAARAAGGKPFPVFRTVGLLAACLLAAALLARRSRAILSRETPGTRRAARLGRVLRGFPYPSARNRDRPASAYANELQRQAQSGGRVLARHDWHDAAGRRCHPPYIKRGSW